MNTLLEKYPEEVKSILAKYPSDQAGKRSAIMPLMYLAQRDSGFLTRDLIGQIADICEVSTTDVASLIGFYTLFHEEPSSRYHVQVCTDLPCALRGAEEFVKQLCDNLGIKVGDTTLDGKVTVEAVTCLAGCHNAPVFQVQSPEGLEYFEKQTVESAIEVVNKLRQG